MNEQKIIQAGDLSRLKAITAEIKQISECQRKLRERTSAGAADAKALTKQLTDFEERLMKEKRELEGYIEQVEDSEIRQLLRYRYILGLTWLATTTRMNTGSGQYRDKSYYFRRIKNFFEKI